MRPNRKGLWNAFVAGGCFCALIHIGRQKMKQTFVYSEARFRARVFLCMIACFAE